MYTNLENNPIFQFPTKPLMMDSKWKSHIETAPNCPRCASSNTKFCYYNNYSFSQPRYFCKACRRYWTKGGSLRNVPVGGGCRKSRRARSAARSAYNRDYGMHNPGDGVTGNESGSGTQGVNIDLGAVFAKFLNQDSSNKINDDGTKSDQLESSKGGASSSSSELAPMSYDIENRVDDFVFGSDFIDQTGVSLDVENVDEILDQNNSSLELQTLVRDDIMTDVAVPDWLDDGWSLCNIIQELGIFSSSDDEPKTAPNPWSSDDLSVSSYENIFSSPNLQILP